MSSAQRYRLESGEPLRLIGQVQRYPWGKQGRLSRIAPFLGEGAAEGPLAEYWLGCHPKAPAEALLPNGSRISLVELLPPHEQLPFMLKVLSINSSFGLSIQSHPDTELARRLHSNCPQYYPDPFHKPEVGVALSDVKLLYNIKPAAELTGVIAAYPEILRLLSDETQQTLNAFNEGQAALEVELRRGVFCDCIAAEESRVKEVVAAILARYSEKKRADTPEPIAIMRRLSDKYGLGDAGLVAIVLMNLVRLRPGEGIFIGPNIPHAYLDGDLVECMACSDNVIRAGLTNKFRDVQTLIETTAYNIVDTPRCVLRRELAPHLWEYSLPTQDFTLAVVEPGANRLELDLSRGDCIALCLGARAVVNYKTAPNEVVLGDGEALFLPRSGTLSSGAQCLVSTDNAQLFIAQALERVTKEGF
ncbi:MAG: mannose-6-phosphate isomerase, class I [Pseudomonadota bacterium]|jgi:mannose-6-phosphate isomerase